MAQDKMQVSVDCW